MGKLEYEKFKQLNRFFTSGFETAFEKIKNDRKDDIFRYFDNIYRVWYYSALFQDGFASPSIFADIWFKNGGVNVCIPKVKDSDYNFEWQLYSVEHHPFIMDLFALVDVCEDNASFDRISHELIPDDFEKYASRFTLTDNSYIAYLVEMALEMNIIKSIPSIHIIKYRATAKGLHFDQLDSDAAIKLAIDCAAKICARKFTTIFGNAPELNKNMILNWLKSFDMTDDIYADLYDTVGVDIISLWKNERKNRDDLDETDRAALSSVYPIGRMIDRYFLTPYGRYMQLIQPIYYTPFNFERELEYAFRPGIRDDFDDSVAVFCPSSLYRLTSIGKGILTDTKKEVPFALTETELEDYLARLMERYKTASVKRKPN